MEIPLPQQFPGALRSARPMVFLVPGLILHHSILGYPFPALFLRAGDGTVCVDAPHLGGNTAGVDLCAHFGGGDRGAEYPFYRARRSRRSVARGARRLAGGVEGVGPGHYPDDHRRTDLVRAFADRADAVYLRVVLHHPLHDGPAPVRRHLSRHGHTRPVRLLDGFVVSFCADAGPRLWDDAGCAARARL